MEKLGYYIEKQKITQVVEDKERENIHHLIKFKYEDHQVENILSESKKIKIWINKIDNYYQCPTCFKIIRETQYVLENSFSEFYPYNIEIRGYVDNLYKAKLEVLKRFLRPKKIDEVKEIPSYVQPCS